MHCQLHGQVQPFCGPFVQLILRQHDKDRTVKPCYISIQFPSLDADAVTKNAVWGRGDPRIFLFHLQFSAHLVVVQLV